MKLYKYQIEAIEEVRKKIREGYKKIALQMPTGSGKTEVAKSIILSFLYKERNKKVFFITRGNKLLDQTIKRFSSFPLGIMWASQTRHLNRQLIFCSAPTYIASRDKYKPILKECKLALVDEAHDTTAIGYKSLLKDLDEECIIIGLSATFLQKSDGKGHEYFQTFVNPITHRQLLEHGKAPELEIICSPKEMDLEGVTMTGGDYNRKSLYDKVKQQKTLYGDLKMNYQRYNPNKEPSIAFCINIQHCKDVAKEIEALGIKALVVHSKLDKQDKNDFKYNLSYYLKNKIPFMICSVDMLSRGVDIPELKFGFFLRPTKSLLLWKQQAGRLTRKANKDPNENERVYIIDFTNNYRNLGNPYINVDPILYSEEKKSRTKGKKIQKVKQCESCLAKNPHHLSHCLVCNASLLRKVNINYAHQGLLRRATLEERDNYLNDFLKKESKKDQISKFGPDHKYHKAVKKFGEELFFASKNIPEEKKLDYAKKQVLNRLKDNL